MRPDYAGTVVLNYRLVAKLGEGGFGAVYLAEHEDIGRRAACKILHGQFAREPEVVDRFFREAKAVCAIGHGAIIDVENFGHLPSGEPFCLMEYFPGEALSARIQRAPLSAAEALVVFEPVAGALAAAHATGIIHRDLKPDNIMLLEQAGTIVDVKLLDFGIAKLLDTSDSVSSRTGSMFGTPTYMAPEQARDAKNVDQRADVYGLGATVFASLAGRPPFHADNVTDIIVQVQTQPAPPLRLYAPGAPEALERIVARCLEKHPDARPGSIAETWQAMCEALGGPPVGPASGRHPRYPAPLPVRASGPPAMTLAGPHDPAVASARPYAATVARPGTLGTTLGSATGASSLPQPRAAGRRGRWLGAFVVAVLGGGAIGGVVTLRSEQPAPAVAGGRGIAGAAGPTEADDAAPDPTPAAPADAGPADAAADAGDDARNQGAAGARLDCDFDAELRRPRLAAARKRAIGRRMALCQDAGRITPAEAAALSERLAQHGREQAPTPDGDCSARGFRAVAQRADPPEADVRAQLRRLRDCRGELGDSLYLQLQSELIGKL